MSNPLPPQVPRKDLGASYEAVVRRERRSWYRGTGTKDEGRGVGLGPERRGHGSVYGCREFENS
jgi:hypothetical protein